jgi:hypothetical protein
MGPAGIFALYNDVQLAFPGITAKTELTVADSITAWKQRFRHSFIVNRVVPYVRFEFNQERAIKLVVLGGLIVVARKPLDGLNIVPKGEHFEMRNVTFHTLETVSTAVSGDGLVIRQGHFAHPF